MTVPVESIREAFLATPGVMEGSSIFSDDDAEPAWFVDAKQIGNLVDAEVAVRLTRKVVSANRPRLKTDERVTLRRGDWVGVRIDREEDLVLLAELVELAAEAHRPPDGAASRPPPGGADLARRRRFH